MSGRSAQPMTVQCPQYSTSPVQSSLITQCRCQANSVLDNGGCMCSTGFIHGRPGFVDQCTGCPAGYWCPEQNTMQLCTNNATSLSGSYKAENCSLCSSGWFKNDVLSCRRRQCLTGYSCPNMMVEERCLVGSYASVLETVCHVYSR